MDSWDKVRDSATKFKGLTEIGLASIVGTAISGLFWLYIARLIGTDQYGEVSFYVAVAGIATTFAYVGAGSTLNVYVAKEVKIQASIYLISLVASIVAATTLFLMFHNFAVSLFVIGNIIFGLAVNELLGRKSYRSYSKYFVAEKILMTGLAIGLYHVMGPNGIILGIALSFFLPIHRIYTGFRTSEIDFSLLKSRFNFMINSYLLDMSRTFGTNVDKLIIAPLFGYALLGNYQLGVQVLSVLGLLPGVVFQYIVPHDASGNPNKKLKKLTILMSAILAILGIILAPVILPVLFPKFTNAVIVVQIMSVAIIPSTTNLTLISRFLAKENNRIVLIGSGIYLGVQIPTIVILGKMFGIYGVATSYSIASAAETCYLITVSHYLNKKIKK